MSKEERNIYHLAVAVILITIAVLIAISFILNSSQAEDPPPPENSEPVVNYIKFGSSAFGNQLDNGAESIMLEANSSTIVYINGQISDPDGCNDINNNLNLKSVFYFDGELCDIDTPQDSDPDHCYFSSANYECQIVNCAGGENADYSCAHYITHIASSGHWRADVKIQDTEGLYSSTSSQNYAFIDVMSALNVIENTISWGVNSLGASTTDQTLTIENYGNDNDLDLTLLGSDMTCDGIGTIPANNVRFATGTIDTIDYQQKTQLLDSFISVQFNLEKGNSVNTTPDKELQFQILMPESGLRGNCTGSISILTD